MKVIEHGNTYNIVSCPKCLCTIEYTEADTGYMYYPSSKNWGIIEGHKVIVCPECKQQINV